MSLVVERNGYTAADGFRATYTRGGAEGRKKLLHIQLYLLWEL